MWPLKAHYLLWFGSLSGILPYVSIFARRHLQISSEFVGILFFILPFVVSVVKLVVCSVADHYHQHSLALLISQTLMILSYGLLLLIPYIVEWINAHMLWWVFCALILMANTSMGAGISLTDYLVISEVVQAKQQGHDVNYGNYRIWGTIGFGVFGILSGIINDNFKNLPYLIPSLIMFVSIELLDIFCVQVYYRKQKNKVEYSPKIESPSEPSTSTQFQNEKALIMNENQNNSEHRNQSSRCFSTIITGFESSIDIFREVACIFRYYPSLIQLSFIVFCFGILTAFHWSFFFWFLEDIRGKNALLMGLCIFVESFIGEIPIFYMAHHIIKRLGSVLSLCLALTAFAIRYLAYGYWLVQDLSNGSYWDILLVEILQGLTFSLFYTVMTDVAQYYADKCEDIEQKQSRKHYRRVVKPSATMQGLMSACYEGIGLGIGSLIGGIVIKHYGIRAIWRLGAYLSIALIVLNVFLECIKCFLQRSDKNSTKT